MKGKTYVLRNGRLVLKSDAPPRPRRDAPMVISDIMPRMRHPSNGKMYDSKSRFRAETKVRGCVEVGTEKQVDRRRHDLGDRKADIAAAIRELGG